MGRTSLKTMRQSQPIIGFYLGQTTVLVCLELWKFQRYETCSLKTQTVPGKLDKFTTLPAFLSADIGVMVGVVAAISWS